MNWLSVGWRGPCQEARSIPPLHVGLPRPALPLGLPPCSPHSPSWWLEGGREERGREGRGGEGREGERREGGRAGREGGREGGEGEREGGRGGRERGV